MAHFDIRSAKRPDPDQPLVDIANYIADFHIGSAEAFQTARYCLLDSIACSMLAMRFPECVKMLGPIVPGANLPGGARVPGTAHEVDPVQAAFNIGTQVRWLDFNDTWLAAEWGHPSDNLGAILAVGDYLSRTAARSGGKPVSVREILRWMIKAHEIQGCYALKNSFNRVGLDHVILVRLASTAVATAMLGGSKDDVINAVSNSWIDGGALRTYRHAPNTGSRKSWAAGDACRRAVIHALNALKGEMGYPSALSAKTWGFYDVLFKGKAFEFERPFGSYVMENVLFKISFPAEFHAQTAVECALKLHPLVAGRLDQIAKITIETQEAGVRIIDKTGPLANPADRDHCIQYMVAVPLVFGRLTASDYEDAVARDPRIDALRDRMEVRENPQFTRDYYDPDKRYIGNAVQVHFADGSATERVSIDFPIGQRQRRAEGIPVLVRKFEDALAGQFPRRRVEQILAMVNDVTRFEATPIHEFMDLLAV
ncbi:MAG TPA: bifunctional 2-methylcitrate dehydratase/aconitate hydratase [Pseudomonadota bacterium]|nr:bifunctional 2-methylcitrate dehydratase/aconitate hydratase [Pseudomonadota bacterium]HQX23843.1 bifunctional 2-methylcitrate dehydratase/aconitate hydratase [Pseudomonadota bacterium]HRA36315.1 bifunctional 2-methylcitrate dehydratase/aconitate hydratase [Pseudomonadota bacterium]